MARPTKTKALLIRCAEELEKELENPAISPQRRKAVTRQLLQAALGLARIDKQETVKAAAKKQASLQHAEPESEPSPEPAEPLIPNLLGMPAKRADSKIRETPADAYVRRLFEKTAPAVRERTTGNKDLESHPDDLNIATASPAPAVPPADGMEAEESNSGPEAELVRETDEPVKPDISAELRSALERQLWDRDSRRSRLIRYTVAMPGELPPPAPQRPAPRISWWAGGPGCPEPQEPTAVDNSDWEGNPLQDAARPLKPKPELGRMDSPKRELHQFLADVQAGKDSGE